MRFSLFIVCCLTIPLLQAQAPEEKRRIGLVLSGGGAKGLAHMGFSRLWKKPKLLLIISRALVWELLLEGFMQPAIRLINWIRSLGK